MDNWNAPGPGDRSGRGWTRHEGTGHRPSHLDEEPVEPIRLDDHRPPETAPETQTPSPQLPSATSAEIVALRPSEAPPRANLEDAMARLRRTDPRQLLDALTDMLRDGRLRP
jgi:hypothetical protein